MAFSAEQLLDKVNTYLATMPYMREPKGLYAPIEYVLSLGGKRIRPVLMLLSYQLYKENVDDISASVRRASAGKSSSCALWPSTISTISPLRRFSSSLTHASSSPTGAP